MVVKNKVSGELYKVLSTDENGCHSVEWFDGHGYRYEAIIVPEESEPAVCERCSDPLDNTTVCETCGHPNVDNPHHPDNNNTRV